MIREMVEKFSKIKSTNLGHYPPVAYDVIMALGIAACQIPNEFFTGEELMDGLINIRISDGASGTIALDPMTGSRLFNVTPYAIQNVITTGIDAITGLASYTLKTTSLYSADPVSHVAEWRSNKGQRFNYSGMTLLPPLGLDELDSRSIDIEPALYFCMTVIAAFVFLSAVVLAGWTWVNRSSHIVKASQPEFLIVICVGVCLMSGAVLGYSDASESYIFSWIGASCMLPYWLFCTGFGMSFSALFAKTWRINKVRPVWGYYW